MKNRLRILLLITMLLYGCNKNIITSISSDSSTSSSSSLDTEVPPLIDINNKDEEGFIIYPDHLFDSDTSQDSSLIPSYIQRYEIPNDVEKYTRSRLYLAGEATSLYKTKINKSQVWSMEAPTRADNGVAIFKLKGNVRVYITTSYAIKSVSITPQAYNITPNVYSEYRYFTFMISSKGKYMIDINNDKNNTIYLFADDLEDNIKPDNVTKYLAPGLHTQDVVLYSNDILYIDYGAVLRGKILANNANNIKVLGGGIVDGSIFIRDSSHNTIPIDFNYCTNVLIQGITFLDPAGWCLNIYFNNQVNIYNIKIISSRSNGDGISIQSCQNVTVDNVFIRSWDDALVVKNYPRWDNKSIQGTTRNILFINCILYNDLAQSMEIGYETVGSIMDNITFDNITVLNNLHKPIISIHNANNAALTNVTFSNITIEKADIGKGDGNTRLIEFNVKYSPTWSDQHVTTALGSISNVTVTNVKLLSSNASKLDIYIEGSIDTRDNTTHIVSNVLLHNIELLSTKITANYSNLYINEYTNNIQITSDNNPIIGATIEIDDSSQYSKDAIII